MNSNIHYLLLLKLFLETSVSIRVIHGNDGIYIPSLKLHFKLKFTPDKFWTY